MDPSRSRRLIYVINKCEGPRILFGGQYKTNSQQKISCVLIYRLLSS